MKRSAAQIECTKRYAETGARMLRPLTDERALRERQRYLADWERRLSEAEEQAPVVRRRA